MGYDPANSPARKYVIECAREQGLRLNESQMQTAIEATDHLMQEMNSDKVSDVVLRLIVKAAVQVVDDSK